MTPDRIDIQKPLYEQSTLFGRRQPTPADTDRENETEPPAEPPHALGGFWLRSTAFLIDGTLLYLLATVWGRAGQEFFLDHPQAMMPLAIAVYFAYFALLNGPIGKGQTAGKWLLGLAVRDASGQAPAGRIAWARAVIQCGPLLSLWLTDSLFHAFPHPGAEQHAALLYSSILVSIPTFALLILSAAAVAFRPDKRALHDLLTGGFVCRKSSEAAALDALGGVSADQVRKSWLPVLVLTLVFLGFLEYQTIAASSESRAYNAFLEELWDAHGLEGFQPHTPRMGMLSNFALVDGPEDATAALAVRDAQGASTDTVFRLAYPVLYYRLGKVEDEALMAIVAEDGLTTGVANWVYENRGHSAIVEPLRDLRSRMAESGAQVSCEAVIVQFYEALRLPWYLGPRHSRLVSHSIHRRDIMPLEPASPPPSHPRSEPYPGQ